MYLQIDPLQYVPAHSEQLHSLLYTEYIGTVQYVQKIVIACESSD